MSGLQCTLCNNALEGEEFDLNKSFTIYSNTVLISFLQSCIDEDLLATTNYSICTNCYDLLNELDSIKLRANFIQNQFKQYVIDRNNSNNSVNDPLEAETNSKFDIVDNFSIENENSSNCDQDKEQSKETFKRNEDPIRPYQCTECPKTWKSPAGLKNHMISHSKDRPYICEICGQGYKRQAALSIHVGMHNGINPFTCVFCNKSFTQKGALVRHMPIHTGELPFQCDQCGRRFAHHTSFNIHTLSHTGEKSYKCEVCGLSLMSASHLKRHTRVHTGEKKFSCATCGKKFAEKYNLAVHEKLHLKGNSAEGTQKRKYRCQICDNTYERKLKLEEHLVVDHQKIYEEVEPNRSDIIYC